MNVLMLGWEYPPHISGGLGTACEGLTRALARQNTNIQFVVPHLYGGEDAPHMMLIDSRRRFHQLSGEKLVELQRITTQRIEAFLQPYWTPETFNQRLNALRTLRESREISSLLHAEQFSSESMSIAEGGDNKETYGKNIYEEVGRYTSNVLQSVRNTDRFDVIHAHDWMTYPAGVALARMTNKPLVVHVHSLEYDRSGSSVNYEIDKIERMGIANADRVIAVSHYTSSVIQREHGISAHKISIVHNGVYAREVVKSYQKTCDWPEKSVLFLGRITFQKGPDYFVEAAYKVIPYVPNVVFIMAGSGDMLDRMIYRVNELGISKNFSFPGFLRGEELERALSLADLYVMPSVSEPFGISALEAISFSTPAIISRQSGVSEVLSHALKVDFWDVDRIADLIINGLVHQELREDMVDMAHEEVKKLKWDAAATKTLEAYRTVVAA